MNPEKTAISAPASLTDKQNAFIEAVANGAKLKDAAEMLGIARSTAANWCANPVFDAALTRARNFTFQTMSDDIRTAHIDEVDVQRGKLKSDNYKWLLARLLPKQFGDRLDVTVETRISITDALNAARARLLPARYPPDVVDAQAIDITPQNNGQPTDDESVDHDSTDIFS